jgi:hypothetical protein
MRRQGNASACLPRLSAYGRDDSAGEHSRVMTAEHWCWCLRMRPYNHAIVRQVSQMVNRPYNHSYNRPYNRSDKPN